VIYNHSVFIVALYYAITDQVVQDPESTPAGVGVFQQDPEQDQDWIVSIVTGPGAGVIFN